ncbi:uncharacterized protein SAMN05880501_11679 [Ureibacillus xyleni]|uniref:DUF302 domain-containing protein n=1 Tax=Ureibacillus xyleni TaxID=614648 RepID=A0A285TN99_9BACL|nr:DUF302 domain-containing protein [Ureibacillus xyleni]SOC24040.1 uncharacterized protein SAMN05880501_11679 [Ureibacillus xyleni]
MTFHYTVTTQKTIDEAIASIEKNLKENAFGILWHLDLTATLQKKGVNSYTHPYHILEVCNPVEAAKVLGHNPLIGYFLPCKMAVYEVEGEARIGLTKPTVMLGLVNDAELQMIAKTIEEVLIDVIEKSK